MPRSPNSPAYPWGMQQPRERLKVVSARLRTAIDDVASPGFPAIASRVQAVVHALHPLVDVMEHLSRSGLRVRKGGAIPLPGADVSEAVKAVRVSLGELASSSVLTVHAGYQAFSAAADVLLQLADRVVDSGITASERASVDDPWKVFDF